MATDLNALVSVIQIQNTIQTAILAALRGGIAIDPVPTSYTVAGLPATAGAGQVAWAANGRKSGEGAGLGSGVPVFFNPGTATWYSFLSGAVVTA